MTFCCICFYCISRRIYTSFLKKYFKIIYILTQKEFKEKEWEDKVNIVMIKESKVEDCVVWIEKKQKLYSNKHYTYIFYIIFFSTHYYSDNIKKCPCFDIKNYFIMHNKTINNCVINKNNIINRINIFEKKYNNTTLYLFDKKRMII